MHEGQHIMLPIYILNVILAPHLMPLFYKKLLQQLWLDMHGINVQLRTIQYLNPDQIPVTVSR